eukprot:2562768-Pyramimonas_sp.AAC.1
MQARSCAVAPSTSVSSATGTSLGVDPCGAEEVEAASHVTSHCGGVGAPLPRGDGLGGGIAGASQVRVRATWTMASSSTGSSFGVDP